MFEIADQKCRSVVAVVAVITGRKTGGKTKDDSWPQKEQSGLIMPDSKNFS